MAHARHLSPLPNQALIKIFGSFARERYTVGVHNTEHGRRTLHAEGSEIGREQLA